MSIFPESAGLHGAELIGEGGTGLVYSATHPTWRKVAVKVAIDTDPATRKLFLTEYSLLRSLFHPGIVQLHEFGYTDDSRPYFLMELLTGGDLYGWNKERPIRERFFPLGRIISALQYLHNLNVIHRDLKGENILMDDSNRARLTDLGLAAGCCSNEKSRAGTIEYMAPEVIDNQEVTAAADIYSLGVILYRLATGRLPFESDDPLQIISLKHNPQGVDCAPVASAISARFAVTVRRCLEADPALRYKAVGEIAEQLVLDGLLRKSDLEPPRVESYFQHRIWSFTVSFVKQEMRYWDRDYQIADNYQGTSSRLLNVIFDEIQAAGLGIVRRDAARLRYLSSDGCEFGVKLVGTRSSPPADRELEFPELDRFAFDAILQRLFPAGIDGTVSDLLYRLSGGNIGLVRLLLLQLEDEGLIDVNGGRILMQREQTYQFRPSEEYFQAVGLMLPDVNEGSLAAVSLLSVDPFDNPHTNLAESLLRKGDLDALAEVGILRPKSYQFARSYYREYFYSRLKPDTKTALHREWVELLDDGQLVTDVQLDEQLYYHLAGAGRAEPAIEVAVRLAQRFRDEQKPDRARMYLLRADELTQTEVSPELQLKLRMLSGDIYKDAGDYGRAITDYARLIRLAKRTGNPGMMAEAYKDLGDVYKNKHDYRRGNRVLDRAVKLYGNLGDELELSHCFNNIGNILWIVGNLQGAALNYETALEVQRRLDARKDIASTLSNLGTLKFIEKQVDESIRLCEESLAIKREIGDWPEYARTANNLGVIYYEIDELQKATDYLNESLKINLSQGAEKEILYNYDNLHEVEWRRGNYQKAADWLYAGLRMARQDDLSHRGTYATMLACLMLTTGRYGRASGLLKVAAKFSANIDDQMLKLKLTEAQAEYFRLLGDPVQTSASLVLAMDYADKLGEPKSKARLLMLQAKLAKAAGAPLRHIWDPLKEAEAVLEDLPVHREKLTILLDRTQYFLDFDELPEAQETFGQVRSLRQFEGINTFQARISYINGLIEFRRNQYRRAVTLFNDAILSARTLPQPEQAWRASMALGETYQALTEYERAFKCYIEAFNVLKDLAAGISDPNLKKQYLSDPLKIRVAEKLEEMSALVA
jgi:tetratricopeptide (TPR) repeat protein